MADEQTKYRQYADTVLEFAGPPAARLDLRRALGADERAALASLGLDRPFAVLTAENPEGENAEDAGDPDAEAARRAANAGRTRTLVRRLEASGTFFARVDGMAPDGDYRERCVAVAAPLAEARRLALDERQLALFWFDGTRFWLIPAEADAAPRPLPAPEAAPP